MTDEVVNNNTPADPIPFPTPVEKPEDHVLTAADIFGADDSKPVSVFVPEWKGKVFLLPLSSLEVMKFVSEMDKYRTLNKTTAPDIAARLLQKCAVNEKGEKIFAETDVEKLAKKGMRPIMMLQQKAMEINGMMDIAVLLAAKNG